MPRILCQYLDCIYLDEGICTARSVTIDPSSGCLTYKVEGIIGGNDWDEDDDLEDDWDDIGFEERDEEDWMDDDDF